MSDPLTSTTSMDDDEGKGVKRKNDGSDALLPTDNVQMEDVTVASPNNVDDHKAKMETLKQIVENNLDPSFCTNWDTLGSDRQEDRFKMVTGACNTFHDKETFEIQLTGLFGELFQHDKQILATFAAGVSKECVSHTSHC